MSPRPHESAAVGISLASNKVFNGSTDLPDVTTSTVTDCDQISSLAIDSSNVESTGLTTFSNEACESVHVRGNHYVASPLTMSGPQLSDLKEYFRRPIIVANGTVPAVRGSIYTTDLRLSTTVGAFVNGYERLTGVFGVRFRVVYTLVVAATPFHQGVISMGFAYRGSPSDLRVSTASTATNVPHVRLDLSTNTMAQLNIPYLDTPEFLETSVTNIVYGAFAITSLLGTPLPSGTTAPTYKLMMHLEDLELISADPYAIGTATVQSGRVVGAQAREAEEAAFPMSSSVSAAAKSVNLLYRAVPMLGGLMPNPAWFMERAAGALRSFGFSKPAIRDPMTRVMPGTTALEHNVDLASPAPVIGPLSSNCLATDGQLGGSNVDEMSLAYVLSQWSQCTIGTLTTLQTYTTSIVRIPLCPAVFWFRNRIGQATSGNFMPPLSYATITNSFQPTTLMAISSLFRMWKGSIEFRITFAKTKFHAGRLLLTFIPTAVATLPASGAVSVALPTSGGNLQPSGCCLTFDLKDSNVVTFTCPYTSQKPFLNFDESFGSFIVSILDPLVGPATVFQSIDYMVEVRAAPDFELAVPVTNRWSMNMTGTLASQSGRVIPVTNGLSAVYDDSLSKHTVGESISSLKQLIQIPKYSNCGTTLTGAFNSCIVMPWFYSYMPTLSVPGPTAFPRESFGLGGFIANLYAFVNGSTDVHLYTSGGDAAILDIRNIGTAGGAPSANTNYTNAPYSSNPRMFSTRGYALHGRFPAYQNWKRFATTTIAGTQWAPRFGTANTSPSLSGLVWAPSSYPVVSVSVPTGASAVHTVMTRAAGDDARAAFYLGPLPFVTLSANVPGVWDPDSQEGNL